MRRRSRYLLLGGSVAAVLLLVAAACGTDIEPLEDRVASVEGRAGKIAAPAGEKHFFVTGVEWKGTTSATKLNPPSVSPEDLSDGYGFNPVGFDSSNPDNWRVASYVWTPGSMIAYQGDRVKMTFFIINGNKHSTWVEAPDGAEVVQEVEMNRGREYELSFVASQAGVYRLICNEHEPSMTAYIQVLPRA